MERGRYEEIVRGFAGKALLVLGDLMMDEYLWGTTTRISPEAPVMVVDVNRETSVPGGAANVVHNLLELGAKVSVVGVVGEDAVGRRLIAALQERGAEVAGIVTDPSRPTTRKTRVVAHSQQVLRVDREQTHPLSASITEQLLAQLAQHLEGVAAILVSEYNKGVLTAQVAQAVVRGAQDRGLLLTANPKPPNAPLLAGADLLQLNQSEAIAASGDSRFAGEAAELEQAGAMLRQRLGVKALAVTRGAKGLALWRADGSFRPIPPHLVEVYDAAGAGDTVISTATLGLLTGASVEEAGVVANHAAACVVRKVGVATVTPAELLADGTE